ncbi:MAG: MotA/TolQ/ExbB proton channel family protein [Verrucomicrobiota bacterium]|nr:MotA/TolQ/ExbB proton channel family protein [Verrucomicrobiota bacterium]
MFLELMGQGGSVLWVIVVSGAIAFVVFAERSLYMHRARIKSEDFLNGIVNILRRNNITEALTICEETPGPVAQIVRRAILHRNGAKDAIRDAVDEASLSEISRMERRLVVLATVAQVAPLLGLLGTVLGMVESLLVIYKTGGSALVQAGDVTAGLMRALVCTAAGLTVAIPCYVAFNMLVIKIDRIVLDMEKAGSEIVAYLTGAGEFAGEDNGAKRTNS